MKVMEAVLKTAAEGEDTLIASLKAAGADEKRIDAAVALYRIQKGFADVITDADTAIVSKAFGKKPKKDEAADEDEDDMEKSKKSAQTADLSKLDPETRARVEAVFKSNESLASQVGQLTSTVKSLIDNGSQREFVAKAEKQFTHIPGKPEEIGLMLKSAHGVSEQFGKQLEDLLGMVNGLVQKSAMFGTAGTAGGASPGGSAWTKIEQLAASLVMKSDKGAEMTKEQKIEYVTTKTAEGKALYREYLAENPAQRSRHGV